MQKNNKSKYFKDWTTKKLKNELEGYKQSIELTGYSSNDLNNLEGIEQELYRRGK
jgi:hypothetical protein